jgi:hypothetical protein
VNTTIEADASGENDADGSQPPLIEGKDYYVEHGLYVFTAGFLSRRGYCCNSNCRNCPYPKESKE